MAELSPDPKGLASITLGDVIVSTRTNFPDPRFHPNVRVESEQYHRYGINTRGFEIWPNADGIGTKPEFAERLFDADGDPQHFESLAFDTFAMIQGDADRFGHFLLGIAHVIDTNTAQNPDIISALARGTRRACNVGGFALLNGETAELGYRTPGYGYTRVNWNAVGVSLIVPDKEITGERLAVSQPVVALRETSVRSNGLSKMRAILEAKYLDVLGLTKKGYVENELVRHYFETRGIPWGGYQFNDDEAAFFSKLLGHDFLEQVLLPWHEKYPEVAEEILAPSTLYGKLFYEAQGGISGDRVIDITGAAHISGGGVPEKGKRLVEDKGLGLHIESPFPDPKSVETILKMAHTLPNEGRNLIDDITACQQWNRGVGFLVATSSLSQAFNFVDLANSLGFEAVVAGQVIDRQQIDFRGHTWTY